MTLVLIQFSAKPRAVNQDQHSFSLLVSAEFNVQIRFPEGKIVNYFNYLKLFIR